MNIDDLLLSRVNDCQPLFIRGAIIIKCRLSSYKDTACEISDSQKVIRIYEIKNTHCHMLNITTT